MDRLNLEKVSWGAIWAGVMITIGMEALFLTFGIFINAALGGSSTWTMAWYLVTMAVSFYAGAWSASRLSDVNVRGVGVLHGLAAWGLATLGSAIILGVVSYALLTGFGMLANLGWGNTEMYGGMVWGGVMLSLITAYLGGAAGLPGTRVSAEPRVTETEREPIRRAS